jgi:3-oxoacyl-[acyl-carrier protein] reductase
MSEFEDKVAVITGGARGFGKAFAEALAARGAKIALIDLDQPAAEETAVALRKSGAEALAIKGDVTDEAGMTRAMAEIAKAFDGIDILINNAGLHSTAYNQSLSVMGVEKLRRLFDVNVMGVAICSLAAREPMSGRDGAAIVNISSMAGYACATGYGVSKLAVRGLTLTMAREFAGEGIRVNAIAPGLVFTDTIRAELPPDMVAMRCACR